MSLSKKGESEDWTSQFGGFVEFECKINLFGINCKVAIENTLSWLQMI
jgi:hypothetical protein